MRPLIRSDLLPDAGFADAAVFPSAVQPFESIAGKPGSCVIAEDEVGIRDRPVLLFVPCLAHAEVVKQIAGNVRFEWNLHEGIKDLGGLPEVRIDTGYIDQPELRKLPEKRQVVVQVP